MATLKVTNIRNESFAGDQLYLKTDGKIGIGNTSPDFIQHNYHATDNVLALFESGDEASLISFQDNGSDNNTSVWLGCQNNDLRFAAGGAERSRIRADGRVSIASSLAVAGVCTAATFVPTEGQLGHRNLIINGAMQVAQRGTTGTTSGIVTVDRWYGAHSGTNEAPTQAQHTLTSSDTGPWAKGFRKSFHITNGNQTGGAGAGDYINIQTRLEAQDFANSGWDYASTSSYITLSFWVKSSVAQNFYGYVRAIDGTSQSYPFETGSLSTNTWTKIIKTIPGNSNITIDNDTNHGFQVNITPYWGTNYTDSGTALNTWAAFASATRVPVATTTWYTTNDATFEITGVQLEVGSAATPFEHRSYVEELLRCQRYYQKITGNKIVLMNDYNNSTSNFWGQIDLRTTMRAAPTVTVTAHAGGGTITNYSNPDMLSFNTSTGAAHFDNSTTIEAASEL